MTLIRISNRFDFYFSKIFSRDISTIYFIHILFLSLSILVFSEEVAELPYSAPDQIVSLTQEFGKIGGIVNPLSGQPVLRQTDLIAKGAQDVVLKRIFISQHRDWYANHLLLMSKGFKPPVQKIDSGWVIFPHIRLDHTLVTETRKHHRKIIKNEVRLVDQNGAAITFAIDLKGNVQLIDKPYGICNSQSLEDLPSGQYDPRNTKINKKDNVIIVQTPHGSVYHYRCHSSSTNYFCKHTFLCQ